ncbi:MAG: hypothetical protein JW820_15640 [Spirochaetales bacterium]|nr:hypothetical protein [Spirochaetales bacterium]
MRKGLLFAGAFFLLLLFAGGIVVLLEAQERDFAPPPSVRSEPVGSGLSRPRSPAQRAAALPDQILRAPSGIFYGLSSTRGFLISFDQGASWLERNAGLPHKVVYPFTGSPVRRLTSLGVDPLADGRVAVTTADSVYLSEDYGTRWQQIPLGKPLRSTSYLTAVALSPRDRDTLLVGTSFNGFFETRDRGATWSDPSLSARFLYRGAGFYEEISGLAYHPEQEGVLFFACGFGHGVYVGDEARKVWTRVPFPGDEEGAIIQRLELGRQESARQESARQAPAWALRVQTDRGVWHQRLSDGVWTLTQPATEDGSTGVRGPEEALRGERLRRAAGKFGIYVSSYRARGEDLERHLDFLAEHGMNSLVVDCKDDFGWITYDTQLELPRKIGAVNRRFNLEELLAAAHARDIYVIARLVVFKDKQLYNYDGHRYAAWNGQTDQPWRYRIRVEEPAPQPAAASQPDAAGQPAAAPQAAQEAAAPAEGSDSNGATGGDSAPATVVRYVQNEYWLDPYHPFVWEYNVQIAEELQRRGVDEIQFDYIRFPSDGNLSQILYRHRRENMSPIDALESFLIMAREHITVPISSDLYGYNSWHRMGNWIGQSIEMLADYVDVISPMFYPSHFPRDFIKEEPYLQRARTIYQEGTTRAASIVGDRCLIRPYVQAFLIGGELAMGPAEYWQYLLEQVEGTLAAPSSGLTLWNASNRYYMVTGSLAPYMAAAPGPPAGAAGLNY